MYALQSPVFNLVLIAQYRAMEHLKDSAAGYRLPKHHQDHPHTQMSPWSRIDRQNVFVSGTNRAGKLRKVFEDVSRLPRRQQEHIVRVVSAPRDAVSTKPTVILVSH